MKIQLTPFQLVSALTLKSLLIIAFLMGYFFSTPDKITSISLPISSLFFNAQSELPDFASYTDTKQKKADFFAFLLPKIQASNEKILQERATLNQINITTALSQSEINQLTEMAKKYKVKEQDPRIIFAQLSKKIDIVPASLVLAQAANESAWGTSRFAKKANNLFGQWCYVKGCGLVPLKRGNNERHEVAKFTNIQASVASYMLNLNTQISYEDLRSIREKMRNKNKTISGYELANGLLKYSTRREAYVHEIQSMIKHNGLAQYD